MISRDRGIQLFSGTIPLVAFATLSFFLIKSFPQVELIRGVGVGRDYQWHYVQHLSHNAFHLWRVSPLAAIVSNLVSAELDTSHLFFWADLIVLFLGLILFFRRVGSKSTFYEPFLGSLLTLFVLLNLFAGDTVLFSTLTWIPWLLVLLDKCILSQGPRLVSWAVLLACSIFSTLSANQYALFIAINLSGIFLLSPRPQ